MKILTHVLCLAIGAMFGGTIAVNLATARLKAMNMVAESNDAGYKNALAIEEQQYMKVSQQMNACEDRFRVETILYEVQDVPTATPQGQAILNAFEALDPRIAILAKLVAAAQLNPGGARPAPQTFLAPRWMIPVKIEPSKSIDPQRSAYGYFDPRTGVLDGPFVFGGQVQP